MKRKESTSRVVLQDGRAVNIRVMDGLIVDDLLINGMKAEGYRLMIGEDVFPTVTRDLKDYLLRAGVLT
jgi:hypothetical protein